MVSKDFDDPERMIQDEEGVLIVRWGKAKEYTDQINILGKKNLCKTE